MENVLTDMLRLLTSGISQMAEGIGSGLGKLVENIFLTVGENGEITGLSTFGSVVVVFAAIGLAIGLSKLVVHWISTLGSSRV